MDGRLVHTTSSFLGKERARQVREMILDFMQKHGVSDIRQTFRAFDSVRAVACHEPQNEG